MVWIEIYHLFPGGIIRQVSRAADEGVGLTEFIGSLGPVIPGIPRTPISLRVDDRRGDVRDVAHRGPDPRYVRDHGPPVETEFHGPLRPHRLGSEQATDHHGTTL